MRICHVIESAAGGSANILVALALHAARRGHEVSVIYSPDRADPAVVAALANGGLEHVRSCQMRRSIGPWDAADGLRLRRTIRAIGPFDVIHSHSSKAGALTRAFARFRNTAQIYSPHGFYTMTGEAPFYIGPVERALSLLTDKVIAVSDFERRHGIELGIAAKRLSVVDNGVAPFDTLSREAARRELGIPLTTFAIGFVGRLAAQKDPLAAVDVIDAIPTDLDATLVVVGDGELRHVSETTARERNSRALFVGARNAKPLYPAFDCLLCTSRYEGMPVSFLEALHCGLPIVSYSVGGTEELVHNGQTGFVVASAAEAGAAVAEIARMGDEDRRQLRDQCMALAAKHTDETMGDATLAVYEEAVRARRG